MPSLQLRWWNVGGGGQAKADAAIGLLNAWGGVPVLPGGAAWPVAPPAAGVLVLATACEVNGNLFIVPAGIGGGAAAATASPTANRWVAVKSRTTAAHRRAQKGYYGTNAGAPPAMPTRFDTGVGGAWTGVGLVARPWGNYPAALGAAAAVNRPNAIAVRRPARRELVVITDGRVIVAWYHATSGGGPATIYDLYEVLDWVTAVAAFQAIGQPQVVVLIGDLNLVPGSFNNYFGPLFTALGYTLAGSGTSGPILPNHWAIMRTGTSTQSGGNELDYAIVMNIHPAPAPPGPPIGAWIQCGTMAAPVPMAGPAIAGPPAAGAAAFPSLVFGAYQSDHRPIKLQIAY